MKGFFFVNFEDKRCNGEKRFLLCLEIANNINKPLGLVIIMVG